MGRKRTTRVSTVSVCVACTAVDLWRWWLRVTDFPSAKGVRVFLSLLATLSSWRKWRHGLRGKQQHGLSKHLFVFLILSLKKISLSFLVLLCSHACLLVGTSTICLIMIIKNISTPRHSWMNTKRRRAGSSWKPSARRLYLMHNFCPATYSHWQKCLYPSVITLMRMFVRKWMIGANEIVHRADTESRHYSPFIYTKKASSSSRLYHSGLRHR